MYIPNSCPLIDNVIQAVENIRGLVDQQLREDELDQNLLNSIALECDTIHRSGYHGGSTMEDIRNINDNLRTQMTKAEAEAESNAEKLAEAVEEQSTEVEDLKDDVKSLEARIRELEAELERVGY